MNGIPDTTTNDNLSKIEEALNNFNNQEDLEESEAETSSTPEESTEKPTPDNQAVSEVDQAEDKVEEQDSENETDSSSDIDNTSKTVPEAYIRAAKHQGMSDDDISRLVKAGPEEATKVFKKLYDITNDLSTKYAEFGRKQQAQQTQQTQQQSQQEVNNESVIEGIDFAAIEEEWGADDPLVQTTKKLAKELAAIKQAGSKVDSSNTESTENIVQQISAFMTSSDMKEYADFYGTGAAVPTEKQASNYASLLHYADNIRAGAFAHGQNMDVETALNLAHLAISAPMAADIERKKLVAEVKKRSKSLSLEPSKSGHGNKPEDDQEIKQNNAIKKAFDKFKRK